MAQFKLYPEAEIDLEGIWQYTVDSWGVDQAIKYIDSLDSAFRLLAENPCICSERQEIQPIVRIHHFQHHLIVYEHIEKEIGIIRVLHENMDYVALLKWKIKG